MVLDSSAWFASLDAYQSGKPDSRKTRPQFELGARERVLNDCCRCHAAVELDMYAFQNCRLDLRDRDQSKICSEQHLQERITRLVVGWGGGTETLIGNLLLLIIIILILPRCYIKMG